MGLVPISTFHHKVIRVVRQDRIAQDRQVVPPNITRKREAGRVTVFLELETDSSGTKDMPRFDKFRSDPWSRFERLSVVLRAEGLCNQPGISEGIERLDGRQSLFEVSFIDKLCILFLDMTRISQHHISQIGSGSRGINWPGIALLDQMRQVATMVKMGVGKECGVQALRFKAERSITLVRFSAAPLEQTTFQKQA